MTLKYLQCLPLQHLDHILKLIETELSEPYSIYTFHYFLKEYPELCQVVLENDKIVGVAIGKMDGHRGVFRGYIGMIVVSPSYRCRGIATKLARNLIDKMISQGVEEIVLETEANNRGSLALYEKLGFVPEKRLEKYYLNGSDAFRLKLWINPLMFSR